MAARTWGQERTSGRIEVTVEPFRKLTAAERKQIREEADLLGSFLGTPATVSYRG